MPLARTAPAFSQSEILVGALLGAFVIYLAMAGRLQAYWSLLMGGAGGSTRGGSTLPPNVAGNVPQFGGGTQGAPTGTGPAGSPAGAGGAAGSGAIGPYGFSSAPPGSNVSELANQPGSILGGNPSGNIITSNPATGAPSTIVTPTAPLNWLQRFYYFGPGGLGAGQGGGH
jgi:hypothetical protein